MQRIIKITNGITRMPEWRTAAPVNFELCDGEHIAIVGPNGSGKTMFIDIVTGRHPIIGDGIEYDFSPSLKPLVSDNIKYIAFKDSYGTHDGTYYLQQRWNQHDISDDTPTAGELLEEAFLSTGNDTSERRTLQNHLYSLFHIGHVLDKYIITLSSGELRKYQLVKALFAAPRVLIMDNPFIGLDAETRDQLRDLLTTVAKERALQIIIVLSKADDIPPFITHVVEVKDMKVGHKQTVGDYLTRNKDACNTAFGDEKRAMLATMPCHKTTDWHGEVVAMDGITIRYGTRTILDRFNWKVSQGEHWAVSGPNGAGKSTLLSLVCADNPQAYACDITLFGRKRGTGESIWDIKRRIGYVSPEMHRAYLKNLPAIEIVASGLHDTIGLYKRPGESELAVCEWWMETFGIAALKERSFLQLSSGEQRLVLLARAFVKDPELLVLDEPLHGLDTYNRRKVKKIIEAYVRRRGKTLIMVTHYENELPAVISDHLRLKRP